MTNAAPGGGRGETYDCPTILNRLLQFSGIAAIMILAIQLTSKGEIE